MPEFNLHQLEEVRLQRELAAIDRAIGDYQRQLDREIALSVNQDADRRAKCQKAGQAGYLSKLKNKQRIFNGITRKSAAY